MIDLPEFPRQTDNSLAPSSSQLRNAALLGIPGAVGLEAGNMASKKMLGHTPGESLEHPLEKFKRWDERQPGTQEMLDHFVTSEDAAVTREALQRYAETTQSWYAQQMRGAFEDLNDPDTQKRVYADTKLTQIVAAIEEYKTVITGIRRELDDIREKNPGLLGNQIEKPFQFAKDHLKKFAGGFMNAPIKDKAIMVAGVAASYMLLKTAFGFFDGGKEKFQQVKKWTGIGLGAGVSVLALEAMNRSAQRAWGRPIISSAGGILTLTSKEQFDRNRERQMLEDTYDNLEKSRIPEEFLEEILEGDGKYSICIANFAGMKVEEFRDIYEKNKAGRAIEEDDDLYPYNANGSDRVSAIERFAVAEDIAMTLDLLNAQKDFVIPGDKQDMRIFYLAMQYES